MNGFVTLGCPSCGGRLQITDDLERFACSYCGTEHLVRRGQGVVSLEPVVEQLKHIREGIENVDQGIENVHRGIENVHQDLGNVNQGIEDVHQGVDKTASELAIQRLKPEIDEINKQYLQVRRFKPPGGGFLLGCGLTTIILVFLGGAVALVLFLTLQDEIEPGLFLLAMIALGFMFFTGLIFLIIGIVKKSGAKRSHQSRLNAIHQQLQAKQAEIQKHYQIID